MESKTKRKLTEVDKFILQEGLHIDLKCKFKADTASYFANLEDHVKLPASFSPNKVCGSFSNDMYMLIRKDPDRIKPELHQKLILDRLEVYKDLKIQLRKQLKDLQKLTKAGTKVLVEDYFGAVSLHEEEGANRKRSTSRKSSRGSKTPTERVDRLSRSKSTNHPETTSKNVDDSPPSSPFSFSEDDTT